MYMICTAVYDIRGVSARGGARIQSSHGVFVARTDRETCTIRRSGGHTSVPTSQSERAGITKVR